MVSRGSFVARRRRPLDESLVHCLLRAGADIFRTVHRKCRDGESVEEEKAESRGPNRLS